MGGHLQKILCALLLLFLTGCITTVAPPQTYVPETVDVPEMVIEARAVGGFVTDRIYITVNGEKVLSGQVAFWKLDDHLSGTYMGEEIKAYCVADNGSHNRLTEHYCAVYFEGMWIVDLAF